MKSKKVKELNIDNFLKGVISNADDKIIDVEALSKMESGKISTFGIECGYKKEPKRDVLPVLFHPNEVEGCLVVDFFVPSYGGRLNFVFSKNKVRNFYRRRIAIQGPGGLRDRLIKLNLDLKSLYLQNKLSDDFSELRFTLDEEGRQPLFHYIATHPYIKYGTGRDNYLVYIFMPELVEGTNYIYMWYCIDDEVGDFNSLKNVFKYDYIVNMNEDFQREFLHKIYELKTGIFKPTAYNGYKTWGLGGKYAEHELDFLMPIHTYHNYFIKNLAKLSLYSRYYFRVFLNDVIKIRIEGYRFEENTIRYEIWIDGAVRRTFDISVEQELDFRGPEFQLYFYEIDADLSYCYVYYSLDGGINWTYIYNFLYQTTDSAKFNFTFSPKSDEDYLYFIYLFAYATYHLIDVSYNIEAEQNITSLANSYSIAYKDVYEIDWKYDPIILHEGYLTTYVANFIKPRAVLWSDKVFMTSAQPRSGTQLPDGTFVEYVGGLFYCDRKQNKNFRAVEYFFDDTKQGYQMIKDTGLIDINIYKNFMFVFSPTFVFWSDYNNPLEWEKNFAGWSALGNFDDPIIKVLFYKEALFVFTKRRIYSIEWAGYSTLWKIHPLVELDKDFYDATLTADYIYVVLKGDYFYLYKFNGYTMKLINYKVLNLCEVDDKAVLFCDSQGYIHLYTKRKLITYDPYLEIFYVNENFIKEELKNRLHITDNFIHSIYSEFSDEEYVYYDAYNRSLVELKRYKIKENEYDKVSFETKSFDFGAPGYMKRLLKVEIDGEWLDRLKIKINDKEFLTDKGLINCNLINKFFKYKIEGEKVKYINRIKSYFVIEGTK